MFLVSSIQLRRQLKLILLKCPASSSAELHSPAHFGTAGGSIGRSPDCTVVLPERYMSRVHVEIRHRSDRYSLKVLSKNNPVLINGDSFEHPQACELQEGDRIVIGDYEFSVSLVVTATPDIGLPTQVLSVSMFSIKSIAAKVRLNRKKPFRIHFPGYSSHQDRSERRRRVRP
ncbi:MAG: FHA domain-containing protein [Haliea sp.]|nr:FHA domain-containing protein [Haliea sp.]